MNKYVCYLCIVWVNQINLSYSSIGYTFFISKFLAIYDKLRKDQASTTIY